MKEEGKFIVIYGINNLGKTVQAKLLVEALKRSGWKAEYIKYPIYNLEPAGNLINGYLREGNPYNFSLRESQLLHFIDRIKFEGELKAKLKRGINVVAEDYFGTSMAWGIGGGVEPELLKYLYKFLRREDIAILFDGERFLQSVEKGHLHENDSALMDKVRKAHLSLGKEYGWQKVNANLSIEKLHGIIWGKVSRILLGTN